MIEKIIGAFFLSRHVILIPAVLDDAGLLTLPQSHSLSYAQGVSRLLPASSSVLGIALNQTFLS